MSREKDVMMSEPNERRRSRAEVIGIAAAVFAALVGPAWFGWLALPVADSAGASIAVGLAVAGSLAGLVAVIAGLVLASRRQLRLWTGLLIFGSGILGGIVDAVAALITIGAVAIWEMADK